MCKWLYDILRDNTIVDNQTYCIGNGMIANHRFGEDIQLASAKRKTQARHKESEIWHFLIKLNKELKVLLENNKSLVLFNALEYEHNTSDNFIDISGVDYNDFTLRTGNLIGYVKKGAFSLKISSRFGDEFLKYIIADADGFVEVADFGGNKGKDGYEWLLIYLWKIKLKKAFRLGLPKQYQTFNASLNKVKGNIDVIDYFTSVNDGKYKCKYREHSYNNQAARLISATFNKIKDNIFVKDMHYIKNTFSVAVDGARPKAVELYNTPYFSNPFYQDYNEVIDLSKLILRDDLSNFGEQSKNSAFFFDVSMLFEYFIRKLFIKNAFSIRSKFDKRLEIPAGVPERYRRKLEPDIIIDTESGTYVFDVKYKAYDFRYGVKREDLFQIHTYVGQSGNTNNIVGCGFVYPISESKYKAKFGDKIFPVIKENMSIMGIEMSFYVLFIIIPDNLTTKEFHDEFSKNNIQFIESMKQIIL